MTPNLIEIEGLLVATDVDPMMGKPSLILERPDGSSVILLGLTDAECNAAAQAYMDGVALRLVKARDEMALSPAPAAQPVNVRLLEALKEAREALQFANNSPGGPITDTIWMVHQPETLFDFLDSAISVAEAQQARPAVWIEEIPAAAAQAPTYDLVVPFEYDEDADLKKMGLSRRKLQPPKVED